MTHCKDQVGDCCQIDVEITEALVAKFAELTGDYNPLHMDASFAAETYFGERVAHGMIMGSYVSTVIGMHLPGPGALWIGQEFKFLNPVKIGDTISLKGEVVARSDSQEIITVRVEAFNQREIKVLEGEGKVKLLKKKGIILSKALNQSKVFISGASRGLGAMTALKFLESGAKVYANYYRSDEAMDKLVEKAKGLKGELIPVKADVTSDGEVAEKIASIDETIDVLVLNAVNSFTLAPFLEQSLEDFKESFKFGVESPYLLLKTFLPRMIEQKYGRVVSILSTANLQTPPPGYSSYNVNKSSLAALMKSISVEYGKHNVSANMVSPHMLRTDLTERIPERMKKILEAQTPQKRLAELEEVASTVLFLAGPEATYINGQNIILAGGAVMS